MERQLVQQQLNERNCPNIGNLTLIPQIYLLFSIDNVCFYCIKHDDIWMRDFGPIFVVNKDRTLSKIIHFEWTEEQLALLNFPNKLLVLFVDLRSL